MPRKHHNDRPSPIDFVWIKKQFEQLHHEHALILDRINELGNVVPTYVIPELAFEIKKSILSLKKVDDKIPDKNVPPRPTPTP